LIESSSRFSSLIEHDLRANAFRVVREGKPLHTFPDQALFLLRQKTLMVGEEAPLRRLEP